MSEPRRRVYFPMKILVSLALLLIHTHFSFCNGVSVLDLNSLKMGEIERMEKRVCSSSKIGDCLAEMETEMEMDSEINRRVLSMQKKFISYETLKRDMIPCARAGAPYYNCHVGPANPYSRGCEVIAGCRAKRRRNRNKSQVKSKPTPSPIHFPILHSLDTDPLVEKDSYSVNCEFLLLNQSPSLEETKP